MQELHWAGEGADSVRGQAGSKNNRYKTIRATIVISTHTPVLRSTEALKMA